MNLIFRKENLIYLLILSLSILGILIVDDYGIGIEEHFQRKSGFYWLNYLLNFTEFDSLKSIVLKKKNEIDLFTPNLFPITEVPYYGIIFDLPLAFLESYFKINEPINYFLLRHKFIFFIFLLSAFFFYKIILLRFNNIILALFSFLFYVFTPRIFGNIFFDNKDILFLSILTINYFFILKYYQNSTYKNLILVTLFSALTTSSRIIGIFVPVSFIFLLILKVLANNNYNFFFKSLIIFIFFYLFFLFIHWPYLWTLNYSDWVNFFEPFFKAMNPIVFFNNEFYQSKYLPISYLPIWIIISTPIWLLLSLIIGLFYSFKYFFYKLLSIKSVYKVKIYDLWTSIGSKFDLFILINFLLIFFIYISINPPLLSGWRHFYFIHFYIIYYSFYFYYLVSLKNKRNIIFNSVGIFILSFFLILQTNSIFLYHPFQSTYFNNLISKKNRTKFEIDTQSLSRVHAIKEIIRDNNSNSKKKISIGTASWTPLEDARSLLPRKYWDQLIFQGRDFYNADYIYSNHYYEVNFKLNKKYDIPKNFYLYKTLTIDGTRIYSIYKKNK